VAEIERTFSGKPPYNCIIKGLNPFRSYLVRRLIYIDNFAMLLFFEYFDDVPMFIQSYILIDMERPEMKKIMKAYEDKFYLGLDISLNTGCMAVPFSQGRNMNTHEFVKRFFKIKTAGQYKIYLAYDTKENDSKLFLTFFIF
jgi:hypothetical protein